MSEIKVTRKYWDDMADTYGADVAQGMLGDRPCIVCGESPCGYYNECPPSKRSTKQEWAGGVPPVGVECEYAITSQNYQTGCFVGIKSSGSYVIETLHGELRSYHPHQVQFRPLKSKADRQREELQAIIYEHGAEDAPEVILSNYSLEPKS